MSSRTSVSFAEACQPAVRNSIRHFTHHEARESRVCTIVLCLFNDDAPVLDNEACFRELPDRHAALAAQGIKQRDVAFRESDRNDRMDVLHVVKVFAVQVAGGGHTLPFRQVRHRRSSARRLASTAACQHGQFFRSQAALVECRFADQLRFAGQRAALGEQHAKTRDCAGIRSFLRDEMRRREHRDSPASV
jgi:hypothetical protein